MDSSFLIPNSSFKKVTLLLDDGTQFHGHSFGYEKAVAGEVVFNTAMSGYPESLTDPSYAGQLITFTFPLIGNYGVPPFTRENNGLATFMESQKIHAEAIIVSDYSTAYSHWNAVRSLSEWLKDEHIPGITGIDTRQLTKILREHGVMMGKILFDDDPQNVPSAQYSGVNYIAKVSCQDIRIYQGEGVEILDGNLSPEALSDRMPKGCVLLVDCGVKENILRCLLRRGVPLVRVPWNYPFASLPYAGLFLANGPGDPDTAVETVNNIRLSMAAHPDTPIFGICMGNQLLAKAAGATIYKLKYGHRSHNQPVRQVGTDRCFVTSQNHGYAVDNDTLPNDWEPFFLNMNDGSNEGIRHTSKPWRSVQFHPEAASGPVDTEFLFDEFVSLLIPHS